MNNEFDREINAFKRELLDIKTAADYTSVRSANYLTGVTLTTGLYRITYRDVDEPVFSFIYRTGGWGTARGRTPDDNTQDIEIYTDEWDTESQSVVSHTVQIAIASNLEVVSISKIE